MRYKITNKGEARTVTYLGVFAKGETREFTQDEIEQFQFMNGVPAYASVLGDKDQFDMVSITDVKKEG